MTTGLALAELIAPEELREGANVLLVGATPTDLRGIPETLLEAGTAPRDGVVVVTTREPGRIAAQSVARLAGVDRGRVGVVDCSASQDADFGDGADDPRYHRPGSGTDLTGVAMAVCDCAGALDARGADRIHLLYDSLSTVVLPSRTRAVSRFLHDLALRRDRLGGLAAYPTYRNTTTGRDLERFKHFLDALVEVRWIGEDLQVRCRGFDTAPSGWTPLSPTGVEATRSGSD